MTTQSIKASKKVFDLDKFEQVKAVKEGEVSLADSFSEISNVSPDDLLAAYNFHRKYVARLELAKSIEGASVTFINQFIRVWRSFPTFAGMEKAEQTKAIWAMIRSNESMLEGLKFAALQAQATADEDEDEVEDAA